MPRTKQPSGHAAYAFDVLAARLQGRPAHSLKDYCAVLPSPPELDVASAPLFVTWNSVDPDGEVSLRGCIGTFAPLDVEKGIAEYSVIAGLQDQRFKPITARELQGLECGVTLLHSFETINDPYNWILGTHGIKASFTTPSGYKTGATFLPDVAEDQGWDKEETLRHLAAKAGLSKTEFNDADISVTRYQGTSTAIRYDQYISLLEE